MELVELSLAELTTHPDWGHMIEEYRQVSLRTDFGAAKPAFGTYDDMERKGALHIVGVADDEGCLHGFMGCFASCSPHFSDMRLLYVDSIFCDETARAAGMGLKLLRAARKQARQLGCRGIVLGAKEGTRAHRLYSLIGRQLSTSFFIEV